jgi:hypothetical protein
MPRRILAAAWVLALAVVLLSSCRRKEVDEPSVFTLNGAEKDIVVGLGPDAQTVSFTLECDHGWELSPMAVDEAWIRMSQERTSTTTWTFILSISELTGATSRSASLLFHSGSLKRKYTVQQEAPAPFFWRRQIGAYGVKGGDFLYNPARQQLSQLRYPGGMSFRILEPATARVCTLSGLPEKLEAGQAFTLQYRVSEKGFVTQYESYPDVRVLRVTSSLAWLRFNDNVYFIVTP